jgi:hypothetical protein
MTKLKIESLIRTDGRKRGTRIVKCNACGSIKTMNTEATKKMKSCGCKFIELHQLSENTASLNHYYSVYRTGAKNRPIPRSFELTKEQFSELCQRPCYYCGKEPNRKIAGSNRYNKSPLVHGIDRVDNNKGYVYENCVSCCKQCKTLGAFLFVQFSY